MRYIYTKIVHNGNTRSLVAGPYAETGWCDNDALDTNNHTAKVVKIRQGCGRGFIQVMLKGADEYLDCKAESLVIENANDHHALLEYTPIESPDHIDL